MFIKMLIIIEWLLVGFLCYAFVRLCLRFYRHFIRYVYPTYLGAKGECSILRQRKERWLPTQLIVTLVTFGPFLFVGYISWMIGLMLRVVVEFTVMAFTR